MSGSWDGIEVEAVEAADCSGVLRWGWYKMQIGTVRRKPAEARISGERDVMRVGVRWVVPGWPC